MTGMTTSSSPSIHKWTQKPVFGCVRQPLLFALPASLELIQVELLRQRLRLVKNQGASLPNSRLLNPFVYRSSMEVDSLVDLGLT